MRGFRVMLRILFDPRWQPWFGPVNRDRMLLLRVTAAAFIIALPSVIAAVILAFLAAPGDRGLLAVSDWLVHAGQACAVAVWVTIAVIWRRRKGDRE